MACPEGELAFSKWKYRHYVHLLESLQMAAPPGVYRLFPPRSSEVGTNMDALVPALWSTIFPGHTVSQNLRLDQIFSAMSSCSQLAALQLCPYYFDQVACRLPAREPANHRQRFNLRLRIFDSWASCRREKEREMERRLETERREMEQRREMERQGRGRPDGEPPTGVYISSICHLQDPRSGQSATNKQFIYMMYGLRC